MLKPEAYGVFQQYKKATSKVIQWLAETANVNTHLSLNELRQAAGITRARGVYDLPPEIPCAFEIAIIARTHISGYVKQIAGLKD